MWCFEFRILSFRDAKAFYETAAFSSRNYAMILFINVVNLAISLVSARTEPLQNALSCYDGSYSVKLPPFNKCSGFRNCELGHFCINGIMQKCSAGLFGGTIGLNNSLCSGNCTAGYYCPSGSTSSMEFDCGNASVYCPQGSSSPQKCLDGYYTTNIEGLDNVDSISIRSTQLICPKGYRCFNGIKYACLGGTYGNKIGLGHDATNCSGICPAGWYCPSAITHHPFQFPCGGGFGNNVTNDKDSIVSSRFCPAGSAYPTLTAEGYYAIDSYIATGGGYGGERICPRGSYCKKGLRYDCPAGRYGAHIGVTNSSCTGSCSAGFYCPPGSVSSRQIQCDSASVYCPKGSAQPNIVSIGYYTVGHEGQYVGFNRTANGYVYYTESIVLSSSGSSELSSSYIFGQSSNNHHREDNSTAMVWEKAYMGIGHVAQVACEPGYYCPSDGKIHFACHEIYLLFNIFTSKN